MTATMSLPNITPGISPDRVSRWLHVVSHTDPRYGGLSSAVPALAATLDAEPEFAVQLAAFCLPSENVQPTAVSPEKVTFWPTSRLEWRRSRGLHGSLAELVRGADALHIHGLWEQSTAVACHAASSLGKPYVLSAHGMLEPWALASKGWKKRVYASLVERSNVRKAACLHALTEAEARQYRDFGAHGPVAVVPNAVAVPPQRSALPFLERFPALAGKRLLLFLSRLHPKKGLDLLLRSWAEVSGDIAETHLVIAGPDGDGLQARLTGQAAELGLMDRLTFAGMLGGGLKWSALAAAEGYVLPSYSEGLSMALLEAMGAGLPVIATTACNMPEITTAEAGWEIEPNQRALSTALRELLSSPPEKNAMRGQHGADLIARHYNPAVVTEKMAGVYSFVLGGERPLHVQPAEPGPGGRL